MSEETKAKLGPKIDAGDGVADCVACENKRSNAPIARNSRSRRKSLNNFATKSSVRLKVVKSNTPRRSPVESPKQNENGPMTMASMNIPKYPALANIGMKIPKK